MIGPMYESYPITLQAAKDRFDYFQALVDRLFCPMQLQPHRSTWGTFGGHVEAATLGSVRLALVATSPCIVRRRTQDIARVSDPAYLIKFQRKGEAFWTQRNREVHLHPGDFVICSTAEPYLLQFQDDFEMPVLAVSPATMRRLTPDPDQFLGVRMSGDDADCGLLSSFVAQVVARMSRLSEPMIARIEANILDLLGGVLTARTRHGALTAAQQIGQIKAYVADHLQDHRLSPAMVAAAFGLSARYVHTLFESETMTIGRYIRSLRVHASRRALEAGPHETSLTDVALAWGFYDLSHMTRCFRAEFGTTPSEIRAHTKP